MTKPTPEVPARIVIAPDLGSGPLTVDAVSFAKFDRWINLQLQRLEARFSGFQTRGSTTRRRNLRRA